MRWSGALGDRDGVRKFSPSCKARMWQDKTMRGGDEDPILLHRPAPPHCHPYNRCINYVKALKNISLLQLARDILTMEASSSHCHINRSSCQSLLIFKTTSISLLQLARDILTMEASSSHCHINRSSCQQLLIFKTTSIY